MKRAEFAFDGAPVGTTLGNRHRRTRRSGAGERVTRSKPYPFEPKVKGKNNRNAGQISA